MYHCFFFSGEYDQRQEKKSISVSFRAENLIPGVVIGFIIGMILDLSQQVTSPVKRSRLLSSKVQKQSSVPGNGKDQELKMVCLSSSVTIVSCLCP
jgi:PTH2 family peptidyl-tRNA hydrolase